jgi:hypothetical protein
MTEREQISHIAWQWVEGGGDQYSFRDNAQAIDNEIGELTQDVMADECDRVAQDLV